MSGIHFGTLDTLAEIERLTAELDEANEIIDELIAALEFHQEQTRPIQKTIAALKAAIAHRNTKEPT